MTISGYLPVTGWLPDAESTPNRNSHISFGAKLSGKLGAGKRHAGFDVAGIGNVNNGSRTGSQNESAGIITEPQSQRASSRPYLRGAGGEIPPVYSPQTSSQQRYVGRLKQQNPVVKGDCPRVSKLRKLSNKNPLLLWETGYDNLTAQ